MIVAVEVRGRSAPEVGPLLLSDHGIGVRAFGGGLNSLRISPNTLNTDEELDRLVDILVSLAR